MGAVVHIGYPKTASTTIQNACMSLDAIAFVGKGRLDSSGEGLSNQTLAAILCDDEPTFRQKCGELGDELARFARERALVVSDEALSFGTFMYRSDLWSRAVDSRPAVVSDRLSRLLPGFRLLVGLRRQDRLVAAIYRQRSKVGLVRSDFRSWYEEISKRPGFAECLDFHEVLRTWAGSGASQIHAFDHAELSDPACRSGIAGFVLPGDPGALDRELAARHDNPDLGRAPDWIRRTLDQPWVHAISRRVPRRFKAPVQRLVAHEHDLKGSEEIGREILARCEASNERLRRDFGVALL